MGEAEDAVVGAITRELGEEPGMRFADGSGCIAFPPGVVGGIVEVRDVWGGVGGEEAVYEFEGDRVVVEFVAE